ncbi:MAG: peptidylprolyl isomerase [Planctomycetes bacterium]|nr:peptidylprolyl isomerase [Planctomycetota bacterium]
MMNVRSGDRVLVHYTARLADGSVILSTHSEKGGEQPLEITAGGADVIPALSRAVLGMQTGEKKLVPVTPEQGFGVRDPQLERRVPLAELPPGSRVGDRFEASAHGLSLPVWVREIGESGALLDANHPLAGQHLFLEVEVVSADPSQTHH